MCGGEVITDILSTTELIHHEILVISKGVKTAVSISIAPGAGILTRNENLLSEEHKTKNRLKISFLHIELAREPNSGNCLDLIFAAPPCKKFIIVSDTNISHLQSEN